MTGYYVGLDVAMKETAVCVIDADRNIICEASVPTEIDDIVTFLAELNDDIEIVGLESGSLSHWLTEGLQKFLIPVKCIDARQASAFLSMRINKTDRNDARGIAEMMLCKIYREVAVKSDEMRSLGTLLNSRRLLVNQRSQAMMTIRGMLKPHGVRLGKVPVTKSATSLIRGKMSHLSLMVREAIEVLLDDLLSKIEGIKKLDREVEKMAADLPQAQLLMSVPGVGPVTALTYLMEIGEVSRFHSSRAVGAYVGLTPRQYSSGETHKQGRISKCGSQELRALLYSAAVVLLTRTQSWSKLKAWGVRLMQKKGLKKAATAVARKLAVVLHAMLRNNEAFRFGEAAKSAA